MNKLYKAIIVDDSEIDRLSAASHIRKYPFLQITGSYASAEAAIAAVEHELPDVAFLDIDMPGMSGLDLRKRLHEIPACIFITSYPAYAVESFEVNALDFLVKPLHADRFSLTMQRLQDYLAIREKSGLFDHSLGGDTVIIKEGHDQVKLPLRDILYLEALKDYTRVVTKQKKYCVHALLGNLVKEKAFHSFLRIHRSYAVQKNYIDRLQGQQVILGDIALPIGRSYKEELNEVFSKNE